MLQLGIFNVINLFLVIFVRLQGNIRSIDVRFRDLNPTFKSVWLGSDASLISETWIGQNEDISRLDEQKRLDGEVSRRKVVESIITEREQGRLPSIVHDYSTVDAHV